MEINSEEIALLQPCDLSRYKDKLTIEIDGKKVILQDPFLLKSGWFADPSLLPPTQYASIYNYLIKMPGPFTGEALEAYKSLDAYNYFISGHVKEVRQHNITAASPVAFVKGFVEPSQRHQQQPHTAWVCLDKKNGYVISAHCTCLAGLGEACSHVAGLLFAVEAVTQHGINASPACTMVKCIWSSYYKEKVTPAQATNLDLSHPGHGKATRKRKLRILPPELNEAEQRQAMAKLRRILPKAAACYREESDTDTASETEDDTTAGFPVQPLQAARNIKKQTLSTNAVEQVIQRTTATEEQILNLSEATKEQRHSAMWHAHRKGRVTASNIHRVINIRQPSAALQLILQDNNISSIPAIKWGLDNEQIAKKEYCQFMRVNHQNFKFEEVGLVIFKDFPFLAASPDGLSFCSCHGASIVEIKCPFKFRNVTLDETLTDPSNCLDNNMCLKKNHKYYTQVQTQMLVCNVNQCDFISWTTRDLVISQVRKNDEFCATLVKRAEKFTKSFLIPEIINETFTNDTFQGFTDLGENQIFCICKRPQFGKMIACCNEDCTKDWFHYECVKLKRKPRGQWFCNDCKC